MRSFPVKITTSEVRALAGVEGTGALRPLESHVWRQHHICAQRVYHQVVRIGIRHQRDENGVSGLVNLPLSTFRRPLSRIIWLPVDFVPGDRHRWVSVAPEIRCIQDVELNRFAAGGSCYRYHQRGSLQLLLSEKTGNTRSFPQILFPARLGCFRNAAFRSAKYWSIACMASRSDL